MNINIKVNSDGNSYTSGTIAFDEEMLKKLNISEDDLFNELKNAGYDFKKGQSEKYEIVVDDVIYKGISFNYEDNDLYKIKIDNENKTISLNINDISNIKFDNFDTNVFNDSLNDMELLKALGAQVNITIEMPGKILETSVGEKIKYDTINIDLLETSGDIYITSYASNYNYLIYIAIGLFVIIVVLVSIFAYHNKKKLRNIKLSFIHTKDMNVDSNSDTIKLVENENKDSD